MQSSLQDSRIPFQVFVSINAGLSIFAKTERFAYLLPALLNCLSIVPVSTNSARRYPRYTYYVGFQYCLSSDLASIPPVLAINEPFDRYHAELIAPELPTTHTAQLDCSPKLRLTSLQEPTQSPSTTSPTTIIPCIANPYCLEAIHDSPDIVLILSPRGMILFISSKLVKLGYSSRARHSLIGKQVDALFHTGDAIALLRLLKSSVCGAEISGLLRVKHQDGKIGWSDVQSRRYQLENKHGYKSYILSIRSCEQGEPENAFLWRAVEVDADILKITRGGVIVASFVTNEPNGGFALFGCGLDLFTVILESDRASLTRALERPVVERSAPIL